MTPAAQLSPRRLSARFRRRSSLANAELPDRSRVRILAGDKVLLEMTRSDLTKGRIADRFK